VTANPAISTNTLYVVLHGLICLVDTKTEFVAYLLDMGSQHSYLCGNFLTEKDIPGPDIGANPLEGTLQGVDPVQAVPDENTLNQDLNAVVKMRSVPPTTNRGLHVSIHLPRPKKIYYFICGYVDRGSISGDTTELFKIPKMISGIRVFEYTFSDPTNLLVNLNNDTTLWTCPNPLPHPNVTSLHIYNEPPIPFQTTAAAAAHNVFEFNESGRLLGTSCRLTKAADDIIAAAPGQDPISGLLPAETASLDTRDDTFAKFLASIRLRIVPRVDFGGGAGSQVCGGMNGQII
jgi:hypothetical protein